MSTTNDEQAKYGLKEKIGPSGLTAKRISELIKETGLKEEPLFTDREIVRRAVESLITKGVLRVAKKVVLIPGWDGALSCPCGYPHFEGRDENFCPGCGSEIVKP